MFLRLEKFVDVQMLVHNACTCFSSTLVINFSGFSVSDMVETSFK